MRRSARLQRPGVESCACGRRRESYSTFKRKHLYWRRHQGGTAFWGEMLMWLCALVLGLVGGFNPNLGLLKTNPKAYILGWGIRAVIFFVFGLGYAFFTLPALTGPFWGFDRILIVCWTLNVVGTTFVNAARLLGLQALAKGAKIPLPHVVPWGALIIPAFLLLILLRWAMGLEVFRAADYRALA